MHRAPICIPSLATFLLASATAHAQCERQKFVPAGATGLETFGNSIDRDGDVILVGAQEENVTAAGSGAAYVWSFDGTQWVEGQRLVPPVPGGNDNFGRSVAIEGGVAVVGEPNFNGGHGAVWVFENVAGTWTKVALLDNGTPTQQNFLGQDVAIDGDVIVVGAEAPDVAYVYLKPASDWADSTTPIVLSASDAGNFAFGSSVDIQGDTIFVGSRTWNDGAGPINDGAVYVFEKPAGGWANNIENAKLTLLADQGAQLGFSIALDADADWIVAGGPTLDVDPAAPVVRSGVAYLFQRPAGGWVDANETQRLQPSDAGDLDRFGEDVAIEDDDVVVGASTEGACYHYRFDGSIWTDKLKIEPVNPFQVGQFGWCVSLQGEVLLTGAPTTDTAAGANSGQVFDIVPDSISATFASYGAGVLSLSGTVVGPCDNELQLDVTGARPSIPVVFLLLGAGQGTGAFGGGFQFWVDLGSPFLFVPLPPFDAAGQLSIPGAMPLDTPVGTVAYVQVFAIDPTGKLWSNGLELTVTP